MPGTARRYMRVDGIVDQRLDPYSATEAAANLMLYNYRLLGSWPLAVTAYNHGPGGLRRARDERYRRDREALPGSHLRICLEEFLRGVSRRARGRSQRREILRTADPSTGNPEHRGYAAGLHCGRRARAGIQSRFGRAARFKSGAAAARVEQDAPGAARLRIAHTGLGDTCRHYRRLGAAGPG